MFIVYQVNISPPIYDNKSGNVEVQIIPTNYADVYRDATKLYTYENMTTNKMTNMRRRRGTGIS